MIEEQNTKASSRRAGAIRAELLEYGFSVVWCLPGLEPEQCADVHDSHLRKDWTAGLEGRLPF